jgi:hypothetical protein
MLLRAVCRLVWEIVRTPWTFGQGVLDQWRGKREPWR